MQEFLRPGEQDGVNHHPGRGLAQLPPHLPLGLQDLGDGHLRHEPDHRLHRHVRQDRLGLRPEDGVRGGGAQACAQDGRRLPQDAGDLGLGRQGHAEARHGGDQSHKQES